jgi:hypothetical protein
MLARMAMDHFRPLAVDAARKTNVIERYIYEYNRLMASPASYPRSLLLNASKDDVRHVRYSTKASRRIISTNLDNHLALPVFSLSNAFANVLSTIIFSPQHHPWIEQIQRTISHGRSGYLISHNDDISLSNPQPLRPTYAVHNRIRLPHLHPRPCSRPPRPRP